MEIRFIGKEDARQKAQIMFYCFQGKRAPESLEEAVGFNLENHIGAFDGNMLAASLEIVPKEILMFGNPMKMGGVGGVTTYPEYRQSGIAKRLLMRALELMREREMPVSFLKPASYPFYRRYGWETAFQKKQYAFRISEMGDMGTGAFSCCRLGVGDIPVMDAIYRNVMLPYNGPVLRTRDDWERKLAERFACASVDTTGAIAGYMIYSIDGQTMTIDELLGESVGSMRGLLQYIRRHGTQLDEIVLLAAPDDMTGIMLESQPPATFVPKMMARIVDVAAFMNVYDFGGFQGGFSLQIDDPVCPWNNGVFKVSAGSAGVSVTRVEAAFGDIRLPIAAFSQMVMGYAGFAKQLYLERVSLRDETQKQLFCALFPDRLTEMNDFF